MSASTSQLGLAVSRVTALRASKATERVRALHVTPIRCHVGAPSTDGATEVTRRGALRAAAAAAVLAVATPRSALAGDNVVSFEPVQNERWVAVPLSTKIPGGWAPRPGQRAKQSKFMLYTDTYGPNYRYTTSLPKYVDGDGAVAAKEIQVQVQSRGGQESITDLGPRRHRRGQGIRHRGGGHSAGGASQRGQARGLREADVLPVGAGPAVGEQGFDQRLRERRRVVRLLRRGNRGPVGQERGGAAGREGRVHRAGGG